MAILAAHNISCSFGDRTLFHKSSFEVGIKDKIGLIGANGTGKTTLFKMLLNISPLKDDGKIVLASDTKLGYLEQFSFAGSTLNLYDEILHTFDYLLDMEHEMYNITLQIDKGGQDTNKLIKRHNTLMEEYEEKGGLTYKSRTRSMLLGLGFTENELNMPVSLLSEGQKTRASLAHLLLSDANLMLLDEPTNHLDIDSCAFLEDYLSSFKGAFIVISHDRYFLDKVTNKTLELSNCKLTMYNYAYSDYLAKKRENDEILKRHYENQMREIKRIEGIIEQQRRWNREKNIKTAQSKQKQIDRLKRDLVAPNQKDNSISFNFSAPKQSGNDVLYAENISFSYNDTPLFKNVNVKLQKTDRAFLLGKNGCGKTTFFNILKGLLKGYEGNIVFGSNLTTGFYDQKQADLTPSCTVIEEIRNAHPMLTDTQIRTYLASFLIKGDDVFKVISDLSGGERAKVSLLKLILSKPNFLLLDEPTNHLDIESKEALENALLAFDGTMFIISHDRYFINKLANKIYRMNKEQSFEFNGNYDYYLEKYAEKSIVKSVEKKENTYKKQKETEAQNRRIKNRSKQLENKINELENEENELNNLAEQNAADFKELMEIANRISEIHDEIEKCYNEWEKINS